MAINDSREKLRKQILSKSKFWVYLVTSLPMGWIAGLRVSALDDTTCVTSVPFRWWTKNPFKSMYFAVQSMAAELSTAAFCLLAVQGHQPSVAFIIVDMKAKFVKKATRRVYFTSEDGQKAFVAVTQCIKEKNAQQATLKTVGKMKDGTVVAEFEFTWSFKQRS